MKLNCIVVDDSSIQRILVTKLVEAHQNLNLIGEFSNAVETKSCLAINEVDLLFLDIEMPIINGFNLLDGLKEKPQIIFITAKAEYALKAFDYEATDYLQKPLTKERFNIAVKRAIDLHMLRKDHNTEEEGEHIYIKSNLKKLKVYTSKIKWIEAFGDYVKIVTEEDSHLVLSTMKSFEKDLSKEKFVRVHKSFIINIDKIEKFNSKFAEIGVAKIPLSRNKKEELMRVLEA
ncbi:MULTISPECIES: LytR/AlgR family response regulator transcription factor [Flavobacterium]|uniref:Response regulator transcription factor n=2 Tax=Flavobacterium TaxID=237 RepID=A0AA94EYQ8_9FLAO|nr:MULTISPECIES: LytTR family DNA-binding domain-containing protein [Flavobacterium]OXA79290.1 DNA-binding response regulator [Flavobacterium columnare NBRC 100251 = ATCC 23463]AMA49092.1 two-component system response regulator [Flavobacterium covae]MCH4831022.1 response regulator transcription factor [Flavobacterium columnare]MCH4833036.1 response regulator transcription factor [Flavobacterium columnare]MCJ1807007.1 LytTR family DNA-binding domain-containing protein [Flavobacterium covae]